MDQELRKLKRARSIIKRKIICNSNFISHILNNKDCSISWFREIKEETVSLLNEVSLFDEGVNEIFEKYEVDIDDSVFVQEVDE